MAYPAAIDNFTAHIDGDTIYAAHVNELITGLENTQTALGVDPQGTAADVVTRLAQSIADDGDLRFATATTLTITTGAITVTQNWHKVNTESSAATDDLDTIAAAADGFPVIFHSVSSSRQIRIRHNVGNIICSGAADIYLRDQADMAICVYDATLACWLAMAVTPASEVRPGANVTTTTTLDSTHNVIRADANGGAFSLNLPAAAGCLDRVYTAIKTDSSANAVTLDGNSAETINGAATYALSAQYARVTIQSDGTNWLVIG